MSLFSKIISIVTALIIAVFPSLGETPEVPDYYEDDPQYVVFVVTNVHCMNLEPYLHWNITFLTQHNTLVKEI